jgi:hypothetical protein
VGRERWDAFLKQYFNRHAFGTMTTEAFIEEVNRELIQGDTAYERKIDLRTWIYEPGIPASYVAPTSERFAAVDAQLEKWKSGTSPGMLEGTAKWTTHEWLRFIKGLPKDITIDQMTGLDKAFAFTQSHNAEIQGAWFELVIRRKYTPGYAALENFLVHVGRRKFVKPLFKALAETEEGKAMAKSIYAKARPNYHSVTAGTVDEILGHN